MFVAGKVTGFICNPDTLENVRQTLCLLLVACEKTILPVELHLTCREHLCLLDLRSTQLHRWLLVVLVRRITDTTSLSLVNLWLLGSGLVDGRSVLLGDLTLHHVDTTAFKLLSNGFLFTLPLGLLSTPFHLVVLTDTSLALLSNGCARTLLVHLGSDYSGAVDVVKCIV